jgi:transcriptional regulator with XRE-family HTH domain
MTTGQKIAQGRKNKGMSQEELSHISKVSLRTIQRIEKDHVIPRPFTLKTIADSLHIDMKELHSETPDDVKPAILLLSTSVLFTFGLPPGNLLFPWLVWRKNKESIVIDRVGRKILSLQILITVFMSLVFFAFPFASKLIVGQAAVGKFPTHYLIMFFMITLNLSVYFLTLIKVRKRKFDFFDKYPSII